VVCADVVFRPDTILCILQPLQVFRIDTSLVLSSPLLPSRAPWTRSTQHLTLEAGSIVSDTFSFDAGRKSKNTLSNRKSYIYDISFSDESRNVIFILSFL
jgi:hypothetical protein